jgi:hypothetical protein
MLLPSFLLGQWITEMPPSYLAFLKQSHIAGIGKALDLGDGVLNMEVDHYWLGDQGTNVIEIQQAFRVCLPGTNSIIGRTAVFFAVTNEWEGPFYIPSPNLPADFEDSWEYSLALTNCGPVCAPRFISREFPSLFIMGSNDVEVVNFCSNFVESVFVTRDHGLYYRTLRDALRSQSLSMKEFAGMSVLPMFSVTSRASETNLVEMLYDPLLIDFFRKDALFYLQKRHGWPATNTVPEP